MVRFLREAIRITIFDGGHEIIYEAALNWMAKHAQRDA